MSTANDYKFLTHDELFNAIENDVTNNYFRKSAVSLMSAINDWPTSLQEPKDLIIELKKEITDKLIFDKLEGYLSHLIPEKDAWKMEAVTSLLEMFDFGRNKFIDKTIELETI